MMVLVILALTVRLGAAAPTDSLDLRTALRLAREHSPVLVAADAEVRGTQAALGAARSERMPRLTSDLVYLRYQDPPTLLRGASAALAPLLEDNFLAGIHLSQPIYTGGRIPAARRAAESTHVAATARARLAATELDATVARSFDDVLLARALLDIADESVTVLEEAVRVAEEQGAAGTAARIDALRAETRLSSARADQRRARDLIEDARERLAAVLSMEPAVLPAVTGELTPADPAILDALIGPERTTGSHPALEALEAGAAARDAEAAIERSATRPTAGLQLGVYGTRPELLTGRHRWGAEMFAAVGVRWSPFDFGRTARRAEASIWEGTRLRAVADAVEDSLDVQQTLHRRGLERALRDVEESRANVVRAEEVLSLAERRYAEGVGIQLEVFEAQAELARIRGDLYRARHASRTAAIELRRAVGIPILDDPPGAVGGDAP